MTMVFEITVLGRYGFPYFTIFSTYDLANHSRGKIEFLDG